MGLFRRGKPDTDRMKTKGDVRGLLGVLRHSKDASERRAAVEALDFLGWQPGEDRTAASYWIEKQQWDKCADIGDPAVEPLTAVLKRSVKASLADSRRDACQGAAQALGQIGGDAVKRLVDVLQNTEDDGLREAIVASLQPHCQARDLPPGVLIYNERFVYQRPVTLISRRLETGILRGLGGWHIPKDVCCLCVSPAVSDSVKKVEHLRTDTTSQKTPYEFPLCSQCHDQVSRSLEGSTWYGKPGWPYRITSSETASLVTCTFANGEYGERFRAHNVATETLTSLLLEKAKGHKDSLYSWLMSVTILLEMTDNEKLGNVIVLLQRDYDVDLLDLAARVLEKRLLS